jgi:hypothetical protein
MIPSLDPVDHPESFLMGKNGLVGSRPSPAAAAIWKKAVNIHGAA